MSGKQQSSEYEEIRVVHPWAQYPWRRSYVTWTIAGATLLCFLALNIKPGLYRILGLALGGDFQVWQLLSACFLEGCLLNLLSVLVLQLIFGVPLEHEWSGRDLAVVYLLSGIGANLLLLLFLPQGTYFGSAVGGVCGILAAAWYNLRDDEKWSLFMIAILSLRKIIIVIMTISILLCLYRPPRILVIVPVSGFILGSIYSLLRKKTRHVSFIKPKTEKRRSTIEID